MFDITLACCSEPGRRDENEDAFATGASGVTVYALLADGAGGHERGADASRRVVAHVEAALCRSASTRFAPEPLTQALHSAHANLQTDQHQADGKARMHTTVVALWIDTHRDVALWSHVGDSRLYRVRYGRAERLTADDSVVARMLAGGALTPAQAEQHPMKNQLLAAIGMRGEIEPHTTATPAALEDGDAYLLCTDGWWGALRDDDLAHTLRLADSPEHWLTTMRVLIDARAEPGQDNFSAIAVWVDDPTESTQSMADD